MLALLSAAAVAAVAGENNGVARRPPMGWSSWTITWLNPNQTFMESTMAAMAALRGGVSLRALGYDRVGLDDAWQACGTGVNGSFHSAAGRPLINTTRFPDMGAMNVKCAPPRPQRRSDHINHATCCCALSGPPSPRKGARAAAEERLVLQQLRLRGAYLGPTPRHDLLRGCAGSSSRLPSV